MPFPRHPLRCPSRSCNPTIAERISIGIDGTELDRCTRCGQYHVFHNGPSEECRENLLILAPGAKSVHCEYCGRTINIAEFMAPITASAEFRFRLPIGTAT
jgi:LSD1 subclass zinc finger protein